MTTITLSAPAYGELETALSRLGLAGSNSQSMLISRRITIERSAAECLNADAIINLVCHTWPEYGLSPGDIRRRTRLWRIVRLRHTAIALLRNVCHHTQTDIGREFGQDHSAICHACQCITNLRETDAAYAAQYLRLEEKVKALKLTNQP